ncbi:hypothetical protein [Flavobacterium pallidum]|uniref:Uncharacterized protein n=1 Tax=Flavobacterium pallidum TaxID=2172098 RepID=A0A2S1SHL5_9FLAO|nr:hypothetical protein [Flavobacterium pallidum]AWI25890.1 hypothetical protein HYN49_08245 [Flavobacterium pallidum]
MCQFTISFTQSAAELVATAKKAIEDRGGTFSGDTASGDFKLNNPIRIKGRYTLSGQNIDIVITDKPMLVPCSMIKNKLQEYLQ